MGYSFIHIQGYIFTLGGISVFQTFWLVFKYYENDQIKW